MKNSTSKSSSQHHSPPPKKLLNLPPSWKRSNYASKTLSEIEEYIAKSNNNNNNSTTTAKSSSDGNGLFNVQYNECSLLALANWAMMDTSSSNTTNKKPKQNNNNNQSTTLPSSTPPPLWTASSWEQYKKEQEKFHATRTTKYDMPIPPPSAFRMCGVCGCFGHYEVECDLLVDYDDYDADDVVIVGGSSSEDDDEKKKGNKRRRLDEEGKQKVISSMAKELRVQRTLETLLSNARREEKAKKKMMKKKKSDSRSDDGSNDDDNDDDDASYWVTSQRCNICLSALGDISMLVCDGCDELYHMHCLDPPLHSVPEGDWFCDTCQAFDDDVSSTVDVEGCGDFVIEQRKRSLAEEERRRRGEEDYVGVSIGGENPWVAALSILAQKEPDVGSIANFKALYMRSDDDVGDSGRTEFVANEVVWAKRQVGSIKYWPGIVSKVAKKGLDVLYFPLGDNNLDRLHHHSELLPFFPYFEDLGYDQVMTNDLFHRAIELSVIKTGLKTLGQALNYARCGTQMSIQRGKNEFRNTAAARVLKGAGWVAPIGWENAEIDEVDGIMIVAKGDGDGNKKPRSTCSIKDQATSREPSEGDSDNDECDICQAPGDLLVCDGGGKGGGCDKAFHLACIERDEIPPGDWICMECANGIGFHVGVEGHEWGSEDAPQQTDISNNATAEFRVDEVVGSIVSWQQVSCHTACYGVVLSLDVEAKSALVRAISILSESAGSYERLFSSQPFTQADKSIQIRANDIGSTMWMPLSQLSFVSGRATEKDSHEFTHTLASHMEDELESFDARCRKAEIEREKFMVELRLPVPVTNMDQPTAPLPARSILSPAPAPPPAAHSRQSSSASGRMVIIKTPSGMLKCPKCSFTTEHRCGMANHAKYCLDGRDYTYAD
uniref:PHD-type domain-containing protein n=1 Tax=Skeletonema marinoi TaxID=267567 RepID=A0A7S2KM31_9STRA